MILHEQSRRPLTILAASVAAALTIAASPASAEDLLWETLPGGSRLHTGSTSMVFGGTYRTNDELADDFNVVGSIERVVFHGRPCSQCNQPVTLGAFVRFYAWTPNGPGALQYETYIREGEPGFIHDPWPGTVDIRLSEPFLATGWHFATVQLHFNDLGGIWNPIQANEGSPVNQPAFYRDNLQGGAWAPDATWSGPYHTDLWIELWGTAGQGRPIIDGLSATSLDRSGRLVVYGGIWGGTQGDSQLLINGRPAIVTQWGSSAIVGYVPEESSLGEVPVQVLTQAGLSNAVPLNVTARQREGRMKWRFTADADYMRHRPGIGPDGSVYAVDRHGRLYGLSADGGLKWMVDALQGQIGLASEGPVVVGDDGTIYVGVDPLGPTVELVAVSPAGEILWTFTVPDALVWLSGPNVGPDGNIYGVMNNGGNYGIFSLTPNGNLRWNGQGNPSIFEFGAVGSEIAFGPSQPGGPADQFFVITDRPLSGQLWAFDMRNGAQKYSYPVGVFEGIFQQRQTQAASDLTSGVFYYTAGPSRGLYAFNPDGSPAWRYDPSIRSESSAPDVGADGTVYFSWDTSRIGAVRPDGQPRWTYTDLNNIMREGPIVSPTNDQLTIGGQPEFAVNGWIRSFATSNGAELWRVDVSHDASGYLVPSSRGIFTPDGRTVYYPVDVINGDKYCYLYALDSSEGGGFSLSTSGSCPGTMTVTMTDATPGERVGLLAAYGRGSISIPPGNPCAGTQLGLNQTAYLLAQATADANGRATISGNAPLNACGRVFLQALDVSACRTSNVVGI